MICAFFGHRDANERIGVRVKRLVLELIEKEKTVKFYVGNNGKFDYIVQCVLREMKKEGVALEYRIVLSRIGETALSKEQDVTIFPEGLERSLPKFAISNRNEWLIKQADVVIACVKFEASNSFKWVERARKRGAKIIYCDEVK